MNQATLLVSFLYEVYQLRASKKDTFQNIQHYLETRLGMDYISSCDAAIVLRDTFISNRDNDLNLDQFRVLVFNTLKADHEKRRKAS